jgi:exosortase
MRFKGALLGIGVLEALAVFVVPAYVHAVAVWSLDEEFSYGFLITPLALGMVWWRRKALLRSIGHGSNLGLPIIVLGLILTLVSRRTGINALGGVAITPLLFGTVLYLWGWRAARVLGFPIAFLIFGLGLYRGLLNSLGFALQNVTATCAAFAGQALGLHVVRDGLVIQSQTFGFVVAEACSGMNSLLSLLALAALWTYATRGSLPGRLAVFLSVLPLVLFANTTRVTLVLLVANWLGQDAAIGFFHGASSLMLFGLALSGLLLISRLVGCKALSTGFINGPSY